jgi:predicted esterase
MLWAFVILALSAAPQVTPAATSSVVTVGADRYLVCNYDDLATRNHTVVIPEGLKTVRGLLVNACYAGGDSRNDWKICEYYRQFMHLHGFAYVGCTATAGSPRSAPKTEDTPYARHRGIFQAFTDSMQVIATASRHPELVNAPYAGVGFSAGGGFALNLMVFDPDKTISAASYSAPYMFKRRLTSPPSDAVLSVPSICITGESEHFNAPFAPGVDPSTAPARIDEVFLPYRPKGAEYAWMERQGLGHEYDQNRQDVLGMPLLDAAVRARYPKDGDPTKGPIKLLPIDPSTGWIADNTTWKSGLTKIYPAKDFKGDLGHSSWLQNEDLAFIYRSYSTCDKPLTITSPGNCWPTVPPLDAGASAPIIVDASKFPNWKTMAFYDGAKKLAEITRGPTQFTATNLTPGYHVFSVLATDGQGTVRTADPKMVVVRRPPTEVQATKP